LFGTAGAFVFWDGMVFYGHIGAGDIAIAGYKNVLLTLFIMQTIDVPIADEISFRDLKEGNSIQVRVTVLNDEQTRFEKGNTVRVTCKNKSAVAKIVSDPIIIDEKIDDDHKVLSLIVEEE
jgi:hypothetical protein